MMLSFSALIFLITAVCKAGENFSVPNVAASFLNQPTPFKLHVDPSFIDDTRLRVAHARPPRAVAGAVDDRPSLANFSSIQHYWASKFDWTEIENSINQKLNQFTTVVKLSGNNDNFTSMPLHFVHHRSSRGDAIPLLFIHGWPGSFLEVSNIIDRLTNPPNSSLPAFHVVAPSIPGFGFSPAPQRVGFGPTEAAESFHALMLQLNYSKYVIQGGDFGGVILRYQANLYPKNVISALSNFWIIQPGDDDMRRLAEGETSEDEVAYINSLEKYIHQNSGYRLIQQTDPLTAAYAVTDSPLGNALWMYSLMETVVDPAVFAWKLDEIITWSMMYYIQGPYGGMRLYKEMVHEHALSGFGFGNLPVVKQPVAISEFPYDAGFGLPLDWARRGGNVITRNVHDHGGHFAAYEVPNLLLNDIWEWFGDKNKSGTGVF